MNTKYIIPVPYWACDVLLRKGLLFKDILNYSKVKDLFSAEEIASIFTLRELLAERGVFKELFKGKDGYMDLSDCWSKTQIATDDQFDRWNYSFSLSKSPTAKQDVLSRLSLDNQAKKDKIYQIYDCEREVALLVIYPGFFESLDRPRFQYSLYKRLLELFYVYFGFAKTCEQPLFKSYISLINQMSSAGQAVQ